MGREPMNYFRDYHTLYRPNTADADFLARLSAFLGELGVPPAPAKDIANRACASMKGLKYHSHAHILSIFDWAIETSIALEPWQALALWFHDVIYDVKAPPSQNEEQSAQFTQRALSDHIQSEMLLRACEAIRHTARHLEKADFHFPEGVPLVLDLDLCMFAWDRQNYAAAARFVAEEYQTVYSSREYAKGRKHFLTNFMGKGFIFRTPAMRQYEAIAPDNIKWEIANVGYGQKANHCLRAVLADLPIQADIPISKRCQDLLNGLEFFLPELLGETYPEWRQESLDGSIHWSHARSAKMKSRFLVCAS
jgi:predicted metal-dependent HD superfamily phosphohydrolase